MPDSDHSRKLDSVSSGCLRLGRGDLGAALNSEILRLAGGPADREATRKHELACVRMAADCLQLAGEVQNPDLQQHFLELARQLTAAAEAAAAAALTNSI